MTAADTRLTPSLPVGHVPEHADLDAVTRADLLAELARIDADLAELDCERAAHVAKVTFPSDPAPVGDAVRALEAATPEARPALLLDVVARLGALRRDGGVNSITRYLVGDFAERHAPHLRDRALALYDRAAAGAGA